MKKKLVLLLIFFVIASEAFARNSPKITDIPVVGDSAAQTYSDVENDNDSSDEYYFLDPEDLKNMGYPIGSLSDKEKKIRNNKKQEKSQSSEEHEDIQDNEQINNNDQTSVSDDHGQDEITLRLNGSQEQYESKKTFILQTEVNATYEPIQANNTFWDTSKNFLNTYYSNQMNRRPMPVMFNSSYLKKNIDKNTAVYVGQTYLSDFNNTTVDFIGANTTTFDQGAKVITNTNLLNMSVGMSNSTLNNNLSGGAVVSTNPFSTKWTKGEFIVGAGYYGNELEDDNKRTTGFYGQYKYNRLKLNAQAAKSKYANTEGLETSLYFTPEFQLTDSISIKTRFAKNISQETNQDEIGLSYKPKNNPRGLELEVRAGNSYSNQSNSAQKFRFSAKFKI